MRSLNIGEEIDLEGYGIIVLSKIEEGQLIFTVEEKEIFLSYETIVDNEDIELYKKQNLIYTMTEWSKEISKAKSITTTNWLMKFRLRDSIRRLVHFTSQTNMESIIKYGLLPVNDLIEKGIVFEINDELRLDKRKNGICLSVEEANYDVLNAFQNRTGKDYEILFIKPDILYEFYQGELANRIYYSHNAAATNSEKKLHDFKVMFRDSLEIHTGRDYFSQRIQRYDRSGLSSFDPTSPQAEIIYKKNIPPKYIYYDKDFETPITEDN